MSAEIKIDAKGLIFQTEGFYDLTQENWGSIDAVVVFEKPKQKIALVPKMLNEIFNIQFIIEKAEIENQGIDNYTWKIVSYLRNKVTTHAEGIVELKETVMLRVISQGSFFSFLIDNNTIHKMEFISIPKGKISVYGKEQEVCLSAEIKEKQGIGWSNESEENTIVKQEEDENGVEKIRLIGTDEKPSKIKRNFNLSNAAHTISFSYSGTGSLLLNQVEHVLKSDELQYYSKTFEGIEELALELKTNSSLVVQEFQLEESSTATSYIDNDSLQEKKNRERSILSFPFKNESEFIPAGTILLNIEKMKLGKKKSSLLKFSNDELQIYIENNSVIMEVKKEQLSIPIGTEEVYKVIAKFEENKIELSLNSQNKSKEVKIEELRKPEKLEINSLGDTSFVLEDFVYWDNFIHGAVDLNTSSDSVQIKAEFKKAISGKGVNWFEMPISPTDNSPIIVEKANGDTLMKVSFFDWETGKYRTYNEEVFVYDGTSNYVELAFPDINEEFLEFLMRTENNEKIGEPYTLEGKRLYFSLSPKQKEELARKRFYVRYQLNDSYTIDYDIDAPDGYRIDFSKHDGQAKTVFQEGNRYAEPFKLGTMIEMNPFMNTNHEGFLYITNTTKKTTSFKITASPEYLVADGSSLSTLIIEPIDEDGNFVPNAELNVECKLGNAYRVVTKECAEAQKRAGVYVYHYQAPYLNSTSNTRNVSELIWITDSVSKIGVQYQISLKPHTSSFNYGLTMDELELEKVKTKIMNKIIMYEDIRREDDSVLFELMDFNLDGKVNLDEINHLNKLPSSSLNNIFQKIKEQEEKE